MQYAHECHNYNCCGKAYGHNQRLDDYIAQGWQTVPILNPVHVPKGQIWRLGSPVFGDPASPGGTPNTVYGSGSGLSGGNASLAISSRRFPRSDHLGSGSTPVPAG